MRITGGSLKGFKIPPRFAAHVRPTTDMMREAVFNKLYHTTGIEGYRVLDLFSGSGSVSLEFISRGAASVTSVDFDSKNIKALLAVIEEKSIMGIEVIRADAFSFLRNGFEKYDIIYADPPYNLPQMQELADLAFEALDSQGILILEHHPGTILNGKISETRKHGSTAITIFAK